MGLKKKPKLDKSEVSSEPFKGPVTLQHLKNVAPLTATQKAFYAAYDAGTPTFLLHGVAGTGKTFIAMFKALQEVLESKGQKRLIIMRSAVPSREIGYLPGDEQEKMQAYLRPYIDISSRLIPHPEAYTKLQTQTLVEFWGTSFLRGITLDDAIILVDECQNMSDMELNSIMTRIGQKSKIIFCGDFRQTDLQKKSDTSGLAEFVRTVALMPTFKTIEFGVDDIVRSSLVKSYIIARLTIQDSRK